MSKICRHFCCWVNFRGVLHGEHRHLTASLNDRFRMNGLEDKFHASYWHDDDEFGVVAARVDLNGVDNVYQALEAESKLSDVVRGMEHLYYVEEPIFLIDPDDKYYQVAITDNGYVFYRNDETIHEDGVTFKCEALDYD